MAGIAFAVGALSMVGVPLFSGFISKLLFAEAAVNLQGRMLPVFIVLGISTILNAIYFMKTVIRIYTPVGDTQYPCVHMKELPLYSLILCIFVLLNVFLGVMSDPITVLIRRGLEMFD